MADIIPLAIGYGITDERTWIMTYAELIAEIEARREREDGSQRFLDTLNGKICSVYASFHGVESCPLDYMVTESKEQIDMSPDAIMDRTFASFGGNA